MSEALAERIAAILALAHPNERAEAEAHEDAIADCQLDLRRVTLRLRQLETERDAYLVKLDRTYRSKLDAA